MAASIKERLNEAMKDAMRAKDKQRLAVVRMALAAVKNQELETGRALDDAEATAVLDKMVKQRRDSLQQYREAGRDELADKEQRELDVIHEFLPQPLSEAELDSLIDDAIARSGASSMQDMGGVMGVLKPQVQGRAEMSEVSARVKAKLS